MTSVPQRGQTAKPFVAATAASAIAAAAWPAEIRSFMVAKYFCAKGRTASLEKFQAPTLQVDAHYRSGHKWLSGHEYECRQISKKMDTQSSAWQTIRSLGGSGGSTGSIIELGEDKKESG